MPFGLVQTEVHGFRLALARMRGDIYRVFMQSQSCACSGGRRTWHRFCRGLNWVPGGITTDFANSPSPSALGALAGWDVGRVRALGRALAVP